MITEKWQKRLDKRGISGAILQISQKLLIAFCTNMLSMVLTTSLSESWRTFFPIDSKKQKLIMSLVVTLKLYTEFQKDQFWVPFFSISISVTYFLT